MFTCFVLISVPFHLQILGLPLVDAFEINTTKSGRETRVLHSFFAMADGSCLAFFEVPNQPFEFKDQHDFDLHIALEVDYATLKSMLEKGRAEQVDTRGISDHGFIHSIYFRDPNGYVVELTAPVGDPARTTNPGAARASLDAWQRSKPGASLQ